MDWKGISANKVFVGLSNYVAVAKDMNFWNALKNNLILVMASMFIQMPGALLLALLINSKLKFTKFFRTVFFMPNLIGGIVLGYIWQLLLNGILIRVAGADLTYSATYGYWGIIILYNWQKIGYLMIIYIAGIQSISGDILEAAKIDGASGTYDFP